MRTAQRGLALSCALLAVFAAPSLARASPQAKPQVRIEAKANLGATDHQALLDEELAKAVRAGMQAANVGEATNVEEDEQPPRLVVEVTWEDARHIDYIGTIEVRAGDDPNGKPLATEKFECEMCGTEDLWALAQTKVAATLGMVETWPPPKEKPAPVVDEPPPPLPDEAPTKPKRQLHGLGYAGIGVASLGVVATVAGAVLWTRQDTVDVRPEDPEALVWKRSYRPPGIALVGSGLGAVVVGGTFILVDLLRKEDSGSTTARVRVQPMLGRGVAGLHLGGSF